MERFISYLATSLQCQLKRAGYHVELIVLEAWILAALRKLI